MPNVGGYFVQKFVASIYHYLQYAYYKCEFTAATELCINFIVMFRLKNIFIRK